MEKDTALTWSWLNILNRKRAEILTKHFGDLDTALRHINEQMLKDLGCREDTIFKTLNRFDEFDPERYEKELTKRGISLMTIEDSDYPARLKEIPDAPVFLYHKGSIGILRQPCVGVVGTRTMSSYGKRVAELFVPAFVHAGCITVSGLAEGIDTMVAKETHAAGGETVAVLGHGLANMFPAANRKLAEQILEKGGLLLSEFPLDAIPDKYTFPARNRIIAGLSLGTVVLEAGEGSGSLITAELALEYDRDVFAVPGQIFDPNYAGSNKSISSGQSKLVTSPDDVLQDIGVVFSAQKTHPKTSYTPQDDIEKAIYNVLTTMPQSVTDLCGESKLDAGTVNGTLTMLEMQGVVRNTGGGMWVRG